MKNFIIKFLSTCGFVGYSPIAPGTCGTIVGIILVWLFHHWIDTTPLSGKITYLIVCIILTVAAIPIANHAEKIFNKKDSSEIVIDEAVSAFLTFFLIPLSWLTLTAGFVLNRFFDIFKFQPARYIQDTIHGGAGIVLDDTIAGIYSNIALRAIIYLTIQISIT
ncbi:phosphatidylglycerophosphatase A [bacterium]|nr:phosphatidylglycerophosphatase A [bacterium]MCP5462533.1 phosphatidylglycerophosphatase A [bacterium]